MYFFFKDRVLSVQFGILDKLWFAGMLKVPVLKFGIFQVPCFDDENTSEEL